MNNIDCPGELYRIAYNSNVSNVNEHFVRPFDKICRHCHSINFKDESLNGEFTLCCNKGIYLIKKYTTIDI